MKFKKMFTLFPVIMVIVFLMVPKAVSAISEDDVQAFMNTVNNQLALAGENIQLSLVDLQVNDEVGIRVYYDDRTHQMDSHWVPFDERRYGVSEIYWLSDQVDGIANGVSLADTQTALSNAMNTWNSVHCANIPLVELPDYGIDWGYVQYLVGMGGTPGWLADFTHAGWLPGVFFDIIGGPGGADGILGATFTFTWIYSDTGEPTDIDNNGKRDVAFREVYYNDNFPWGIDTYYPIDVESIVLHEMGHGLSMDHFGKIFRTLSNGKLHFAPAAVMNAAYTGVKQDLYGTDNGSFCSIWASWPNN